jgi:hypothetical protein
MSDGINDGHKYAEARSIYHERSENPEAQGNVIERMIEAYDKAHEFPMTAALRVALDEALGPVTDEEWDKATHEWPRTSMEHLTAILAARRARLLPEPDGTLTARRNQPDDFEQFTSGLPNKPAGSNLDAPIRRREQADER